MVSICGIPITILDPRVAREKVVSWLDEPSFHWIVTANPEILLHSHRDRSYRDLLAKADYVTPDGSGVILMANVLGYGCTFKQRFTGVDLTLLLLRQAVEKEYMVLIVLPDNSLTDPEALDITLTNQYPGLRVIVRRDAAVHTLTSHDREQVHVLFTGHGAPRQERWINDHHARFPNVRIAVGVGGTFDFLSGTLQRAPRWMRRIGMEWLFRLVIEPSRIRRIMRAIIVFPLIAMKDRHYE